MAGTEDSKPTSAVQTGTSSALAGKEDCELLKAIVWSLEPKVLSRAREVVLDAFIAMIRKDIQRDGIGTVDDSCSAREYGLYQALHDKAKVPTEHRQHRNSNAAQSRTYCSLPQHAEAHRIPAGYLVSCKLLRADRTSQ